MAESADEGSVSEVGLLLRLLVYMCAHIYGCVCVCAGMRIYTCLCEINVCLHLYEEWLGV